MKKGLVLVDIQNDYFPGGRVELVEMEAASKKAQALLSRFREEGLPTFHIQHLSLGPKAGFFIPETDGAKIHDNVEPLSNDMVIQKHFPNSFRKTALEAEMRKAGVEEAVICGAMSHMCIDATTRAAADLGFKCTVIHDACATRDLEFEGNVIKATDVHQSFMAALQFFYAKVVECDRFIKEMSSES